MIDLTSHSRNVYSQYGEDGILEAIFNRLEVHDGYFCEFGAWDGQHLSNSYALYKRGWSGCYIEGDSNRFKDLARNISRPEVKTVCAFVGVTGENTLDRILARAEAPRELDLLSIDIDSDDLSVWRSVEQFSPKVVVIEFNPSIPIGIVFENDGGGNRGNSATAIHIFARKRGYSLVAQTDTNLIYVRADLSAAAGFAEIEPQLGVSYFFGYDGTLLRFHKGSVQAEEFYKGPWGDWVLMQPLPAVLRKFDSRNIGQTLYSLYSVLVTRPFAIPAIVAKLLSARKSQLKGAETPR